MNIAQIYLMGLAGIYILYLQVKPVPITAFVNKIFLEHSHIIFFMFSVAASPPKKAVG